MKSHDNVLSLFEWPIVASDAVPRGTDVVALGVPVDRYSAAGGSSEAPDRMRALPVYDRYGTFDLSSVKGADIGNVDPWSADPPDEMVRALMALPEKPLKVVIGGDDAISLEVQKTFGQQLIHFDAHTDMWQYPNDQLRHGSWVRQVQVPVAQFGTRVGPDACADELDPQLDTVLVVDIDVADPSCAPGVLYPVPGGWSSKELLDRVSWAMALYDVKAVVVTEVNPVRDHNDMTSWLAQFVIVRAIEGHMMKKTTKKVRGK